MHLFIRYLRPLILTMSVLTTWSAAQWEARFGRPPINPNSGLEINPKVFYDPITGIVSLDNAGDNGLVDSLTTDFLLGDDVGMISFVMTTRLNSNTDIETLLPVFEDGVVWSPPIYFDDRVQLQGTSIHGIFLPILESPTALFGLPTGLVEADFLGPSGLLEIEIGINFDVGLPGATLFSVGDPFTSGAFQILPAGDFDGDLDWDCDDVDALVAEIVSGEDQQAFDLSGDALVDETDLEVWLRVAGEQNLPRGAPYLRGDGNLDGTVDVSDFNLWNGNKFTQRAAWCSGDFNADGFVDVSDFNAWNENKFSGRIVSVPEPNLFRFVSFGALLFVGARRRLEAAVRRADDS